MEGSIVVAARGDNGRTARVALIGAEATFFQTLGTSILRGRSFDRTEADAHSAVTVVSEAAAAVLWPGEEPIGSRLTMTSGTRTSTVVVVGVSRNALDAGGMMRAGLMAADIYIPLDAETSEVVLLARTTGDPRLLVKVIARATRSSPSSRMLVAHVLDTSLVREDSLFVIRLFGGFSILALLLAASGIFGVISQSVVQRTAEFGVRMAMGASAGQVLRMVLGREGRLIVAAVGTGIVGTVIVTRSAFVEMLVVAGSDPLVWMAVGALCGGVAAAAVGLATWRIVKPDPWKVLRQA